MSYLTIAKYGVIAAIVAFVTWATIDRFALAKVVARSNACAAAASSIDKPLTACAAPLAARVEQARQAETCESALGNRQADGALYAIRASCGAEVKRLDAAATAAIADAADLRKQLAEASADRDAAIARAQARTIASDTRNATNAHTIASAPRQPDGRVACDADCVRAIAGD